MRHALLIISLLILFAGCGQSPDKFPIDVKDLANFELDQANGTTSDIPQRWRALDGKHVELVGEIWAPQGDDNAVAQFQLAGSIKWSWDRPKVQNFVDCKVSPPRKLAMSENLVHVFGVLHVGVKKDRGKVVSVYQLDVDRIEPPTPESH